MAGGDTTTYAYDRAGNRTGVWVTGTQTVSHTFNAAHQVVGWMYDAAGNLLRDGVNQYTYDALNRLTSANDTISQDTGDGPLVAQTTQGLTTRYSQDLAAPLPQVLTTGGANYLYGHDRLATQDGSTRTWEVHDALGSVRQTLDAAGSVGTTALYDPWGSPLAGTPAPFGFTGELHSEGLVYLRARWYDPSSGTFTGRDPFAGFPEQPYSLHPYQYGQSNPVRWTDPRGRCLDEQGNPCLQPGIAPDPNWEPPQAQPETSTPTLPYSPDGYWVKPPRTPTPYPLTGKREPIDFAGEWEAFIVWVNTVPEDCTCSVEGIPTTPLGYAANTIITITGPGAAN